MRSSATSKLLDQPRSGPTEIARIRGERTWSWLEIRKIWNGQSFQKRLRNKLNGSQASKNASQLETIIATESLKSTNCAMGDSSRIVGVASNLFQSCLR